MKYPFKLILVMLTAVALIGCEKQEYLKSESEIKKELAYSWKQILMSKDTNVFPNYQMWTFKDDQLTIVIKKASDNTPLDTMVGTYTVNTTLTKVFINTADFPGNDAFYWLNAEWTVVGLDSKGLVVASEDPHAGGINEREFVRMD
jgi:hypothetical protein